MTGISFLTKGAVAGLIVGGIGGLVLALGAEEMDRITSTDAFCTSCHLTGEYIAKSEAYLTSSHRTRTSGVEPGCADCHIPKGLVPATWTHVIKGVQDLYGEFAYDYQDPAVWKERRPELAYAVRDGMRANDSANCRSCHDEAEIRPARKRGQRQHANARETGMTCIDCHYNLVHEAVEPRQSFLEQAGTGQ